MTGAAGGAVDEAEAAELFEAAFGRSGGILLAVSGGPDSMALFGLMTRWKAHPPLAAATVDHGLRAASAGEAAMVAETAARLGVPHRTLPWTGAKPASGLQEAARKARHALLAAEAKRLGFPHLAMAHHQDDQAETVLMRLSAGSGLAGLAGMRRSAARDGLVLARPLLGLPKARLVATCAALGLPFAEDPSNDDPRFGRVRARRALAVLAKEGLTPSRLARLATRAARAEEALASMARAALARAGLSRTDCVARADWRALAAEPEEIRLRALGAMLRPDPETSEPQKLEKLEALLASLDAASAARARLRRSLGESIVTLKAEGRLIVSPAPPRRRVQGR